MSRIQKDDIMDIECVTSNNRKRRLIIHDQQRRFRILKPAQPYQS